MTKRRCYVIRGEREINGGEGKRSDIQRPKRYDRNMVTEGLSAVGNNNIQSFQNE